MNAIELPKSQRLARILLVEDNPGDILLMRHIFKQAKISNIIETATLGEQALSMLQQKNEYELMPLPDLILLDLNLPGMSGHDVLKAIKNNDALKHIPVIILSSSQAEIDKKTSLQLNADGYLLKPLRLEHFHSALLSLNSFCFSIMIASKSKE